MVISGFGPTRGSSSAGIVVETVMIAATIGSIATPVVTGENPRSCCRT